MIMTPDSFPDAIYGLDCFKEKATWVKKSEREVVGRRDPSHHTLRAFTHSVIQSLSLQSA